MSSLLLQSKIITNQYGSTLSTGYKNHFVYHLLYTVAIFFQYLTVTVVAAVAAAVIVLVVVVIDVVAFMP